MANRILMASIDAAWLGMEDPTNLMMVTGLLALDGKLDMRRLRTLLNFRLKPFRRFHQRVVRPRTRGKLPHWEDDVAFDIDNHVSRVALPGRGGDDALRDKVSELMSLPLDFSRPLWHIHVIDKYKAGSVAVVRVHHCLADGIALVRVMLSLTDESPEGTVPTPPALLPRGCWGSPPTRASSPIPSASWRTSPSSSRRRARQPRRFQNRSEPGGTHGRRGFAKGRGAPSRFSLSITW
ncbi:MAG TPA: wax ester/triacylglycerol synthase domain-containing protein [Clostridia bacterium]|nr:wax ester/triacylglycerol synthase domain-containing protein [Clostridia bacterium]